MPLGSDRPLTEEELRLMVVWLTFSLPGKRSIVKLTIQGTALTHGEMYGGMHG